MKIRKSTDGYSFFCPGCDCAHGFTEKWGITGEGDNLTLASSLGTNMGRPDQCHAMMECGRLRFLDDCYHALKGQTVDIPEWPYD